jgi:uncharacterized membrane protein
MAGEKMEATGASSDSKLWAALSYPIWIVALFVIFTEKKNDKWLAFHAYQALILGLVLWAIIFVTSWFFIGCLLAPLAFLVELYYGYKAYQGEKFKIPTIGDMAEGYVK